MSQSGAQAAAFFREVARSRVIWFVRDDVGSPAPVNSSGLRVAPYWSSRARAERAAKVWGAGLRAQSIPLAHWRELELPELARDGLLVGINWSGSRLVGWEFTVAEVGNRLAHIVREDPYASID